MTMESGTDYVICRECTAKVKAIAHFHLRKCCGLSVREYRLKYPDAPLRATCVNRKVSAAYRNPDSGYNTPEHIEFRKEQARKNWRKGGRWRNDSSRARRSEAVSKAMNNPDSYFQSDEARRKRSKTLRRRWKNPEDGIGSEEANRKRSKSMIDLWKDPNSNMNTLETNARRSAITRAAWNRPDSPYRTEECRERRSIAAKTLWEQGVFDGAFRSPTSIEIQIREALDKFGLDHQSQWSPIGYTKVYDELVRPNILIEVHGSHWHTSRKQQEKDLEKARWAHDNGYNFIAIWDFHLKEYGADFLVEKWILPLGPEVDSKEYHYMSKLF